MVRDRRHWCGKLLERFHRFDQGGVVILDIADARADGPAGYLVGWKRREQGPEVGRVRRLFPSQTGQDSGLRTTGMRL